MKESEIMQPKISLLSDQLIKQILDEAFQLMMAPGIKVQSPEARKLLAEAGATVDDSAEVVHIPEKIVRKALETVPSIFHLYNRRGEPAITYGGDAVHFDPGSSGVHVLDPDTLEHKPSHAPDLVRLVKVAEMLPEVSLNERKQKIETVLNEIESKYIKKGINIRIIVLPEYSIENCIVPFLKTYSLKNGLMIIAGDYNQTERSNFAQIIHPHDGQSIAVKQFKLSTSKYDQAYLSELHKSKRNIYKFSWPSATSKREKNMITVYVCHDFLEHIFHTIDNKMAGLYIVIMCSPRVEEFYGLSCATLRITQSATARHSSVSGDQRSAGPSNSAGGAVASTGSPGDDSATSPSGAPSVWTV